MIPLNNISSKIEILYDDQNQPWFKRAHVGTFLDLPQIYKSLGKLDECEMLTRNYFEPTQSATPGWSGPKDQQNITDVFLSLTGVLYVIVNARKDRGKELKHHILTDVIPRGLNDKMKEQQRTIEDHQQAMEEKDMDHRVAIQRKDSHIALITHNHDIANGIIRARDMEIENLVRNRHVPLSGRGYDEVFIIVKKISDCEELYPLYLICRQKRSARQALLKLRMRYPHLDILTQFDTPNSIHRWNEIKQRNPAVIQWSDRHFRILNPDIERLP